MACHIRNKGVNSEFCPPYGAPLTYQRIIAEPQVKPPPMPSISTI